jgi:hypothetical protein
VQTKACEMADTAPPVEANKRSLMFLDRGDKATQPRQAFAELPGGNVPEGALILFAPSRRALFSSIFPNNLDQPRENAHELFDT